MKKDELREYKTLLDYAVRDVSTTAEGAAFFGEGLVPYIAKRPAMSDLDQVVEAAVDRGLIAGVKKAAAKEIADGIMTQVMDELRDGNGVAFGKFFTARPFLLGMTDAAGTLTAANSLHVKIAAGDEFGIDRGDFRWRFVSPSARPKIKYAESYAAGAVKDELQRGKAIQIHGSALVGAGGPSVFTLKTGGVSHTLAQTDVVGPELVVCEWPEAEIAAGAAVLAVKTFEGRLCPHKVAIV